MSHRLKPFLTVVVFLTLLPASAFAQLRFSIATEVSLLRNFSPHQKFWAFGQGVEGDFHFTKKNTLYAWIDYHTKGSFSNSFMAPAKSPGTSPEAFPYTVKGKWGMRQVSIGWKHYMKGSFNESSGWNLYGAAGFGLLFSKIQNSLETRLDTATYQLLPAPAMGAGNFKRLTLDLSLGVEYPVADGFFLYGDLRTCLPSSDDPSSYFHDQQRVPLPLMINAGLRILFGYDE